VGEQWKGATDAVLVVDAVNPFRHEDAGRLLASFRERLAAMVAALAPARGERFLFKPRYSAFDHTPLELILGEEGVERVILIGGAVEGCVVQTAIDAREVGLKATIVVDACATVDEELERVALDYAVGVGGVHTESSPVGTAR
jgi:nicotinamidase-related amidase